MLHLGDCLIKLKDMPDNSVDSLVTDPPAGISFMGKEWDKSDGFIPSMKEIFKECLRVLKPGAHGLVWAIPRTSHWTATALEDAGFEIRDVVTHIFGSGFPKSLDISKAIDKAAGAEREKYLKPIAYPDSDCWGTPNNNSDGSYDSTSFNTHAEKVNVGAGMREHSLPSTPEAKQWEGWGTALKPASEHWILVRKPLSEKTVAANVLKHGTGGINIDASRIGTEIIYQHQRDFTNAHGNNLGANVKQPVLGITNYTVGRFPANLVLSHNPDCEDNCTLGCAVAALDEQSGYLHGRQNKVVKQSIDTGMFGNGIVRKNKSSIESIDLDKGGGASRFFYCAKAPDADKFGICHTCDGEPKSKKLLKSCIDSKHDTEFHPTVKSTTLMSYLIKLITPPNGIVLDPFMGSGSTGVAAIKDGFKFIGIEQNMEYLEIAKRRIDHETQREAR